MKKYTYMAITGIIGLAFSQFLIYDYAPLERSMGYAQKIFYYHLPLAWWSFVSFFISFMSAIIYLVKRKTYYDRLSAVSAEIGAFGGHGIHVLRLLLCFGLYTLPT